MARFIRVTNILIFLALLICGNCLFYGKAFLIPCPGKYFAHTNEYLAYSNDIGVIEQGALYHDIGSIHESVQKSDIIFLGSSNMQMGWDLDELNSYCDLNKFTIYNLSLGNGEGYAFFHEYIKKHPIRNKMLVLNINKDTESRSKAGCDAIQVSGRKQISTFLESQSFIRAKSVSEALLPEWVLKAIDYGPATMVLFRSFNRGFWNSRYFPGMEQAGLHCTIKNTDVIDYSPQCYLKQFIDASRENGCLVVLTQVPTTDSFPAQVKKIAEKEKLDVILYDRPYDSLFMFDGTHLCKQSAREFTRFMLPRLFKLLKDSREHGLAGRVAG